MPLTTSRFEAARAATAEPSRYRKRIEDTAGQSDLFTGETRRPAKVQGQLHWITLKSPSGDGTTHVQVDGKGNIHLGPAALKGRSLLDLKKRSGSGDDDGGNGGEKIDEDAWRTEQTQSRLANQPDEHFDEWHDEPAKATEPEPPVDPLAKLRKEDGQPVGATTIHVSQLKVDPKRFQYKISGIDPTTGTNAELKKVKQYNPMLGGQLLVWHDPADGQTYVVNGHHRYELASRSPMGDGTPFDGQMSVFYVNAKDATEARAHGALTNIAEGRGTAVDAAKFLRDTNGTDADFAKHGVSLTGSIASSALHLKDLSPTLFQKLTNGGMTEGRALAIAKHLKNPDVQDQLAQYIDKREQTKGTSKTFTDGKVAEMARATAAAKPIRVNAGGGMFDDWFDSNPIEQRADIADHIRKHLSSEHRTFREASSSKRQGMLEGTGTNQLDVAGNRERAGAAASDLEEFDHRVNAAGHAIAVALDQYAERLFSEPKQRTGIVNEALKHVRGILAGDSSSGPADDAQPGSEGPGDSVRRADDPRGGDSSPGVHRDPEVASKFSRFAAAQARVMRCAMPESGRSRVVSPIEGPHAASALPCRQQTREHYAKAFDESQHPREPKGSPEGGEFAKQQSDGGWYTPDDDEPSAEKAARRYIAETIDASRDKWIKRAAVSAYDVGAIANKLVNHNMMQEAITAACEADGDGKVRWSKEDGQYMATSAEGDEYETGFSKKLKQNPATLYELSKAIGYSVENVMDMWGTRPFEKLVAEDVARQFVASISDDEKRSANIDIEERKSLYNARVKWWDENIGGSETFGRTYKLFLEGNDRLLEAYGEDDEASDEEVAMRVMDIARRRHEETDYDDLLASGVDRDEARRQIASQMDRPRKPEKPESYSRFVLAAAHVMRYGGQNRAFGSIPQPIDCRL